MMVTTSRAQRQGRSDRRDASPRSGIGPEVMPTDREIAAAPKTAFQLNG
jgi:hypothetical protein